MPDRRFLQYQLTGPQTFQDRLTALAVDEKTLWYTRQRKDRVGVMDIESGKYREVTFKHPAGLDLGLAVLTTFPRVSPRQRSVPLLIGAVEAKGLILYMPGRKRAALFQVESVAGELPYEAWLRPEVLGIDRSLHPWVGGGIRHLEAPSWAGFQPVVVRLERDFQGRVYARFWVLPPSVKGGVRDFWFDTLDRAWYAVGHDNLASKGGRSCGVTDLSRNEHFFFDLGSGGHSVNHTDLVGWDSQPQMCLNWPHRGGLFLFQPIYTPYPWQTAPYSSCFQMMGTRYFPPSTPQSLSVDPADSVWYSAGQSGVGCFHQSHPASEVIDAQVCREAMTELRFPVKVTQLVVEEDTSKASTPSETVVQGQVDAGGHFVEWDVEPTVGPLVTIGKDPWFTLPLDNRIGALVP